MDGFHLVNQSKSSRLVRYSPLIIIAMAVKGNASITTNLIRKANGFDFSIVLVLSVIIKIVT